MFDLSALDLARIQFAFTISFHIVFPAITIGLASFLAFLEYLWLKTQRDEYRRLYHYWLKIFSVAFGMGVVSGIVMAYQFGTNWSSFSVVAGGITGPLLAYEVLTAFFLEAGFLGVMLFGWDKVGPRLHFFSTLMVAIGTLVSATWIIASNSWMQTPAGFEMQNGIAVPLSWIEIIFNPSFPYRLLHMVIAAFLAVALIVAATGAFHLLKKRASREIKIMFSLSLWAIVILTPVQIFIGDLHGLNTLKHQPVKIAAMEGNWQRPADQQSDPFILFALPDQTQEKNHYTLSIPQLASWILTHSANGKIPALKDFPPEDRPPVAAVFWSFRVMLGLGGLMLLVAIFSVYLRFKKQLFTSRWFLKLCVWMGPSGLVAILAGWFVTELGRQPWLIYEVMRTSEGVSNHSVTVLASSLLIFIVVYVAVFGLGTLYGLRLMAKAPCGPSLPSPFLTNNASKGA